MAMYRKYLGGKMGARPKQGHKKEVLEFVRQNPVAVSPTAYCQKIAHKFNFNRADAKSILEMLDVEFEQGPDDRYFVLIK